MSTPAPSTDAPVLLLLGASAREYRGYTLEPPAVVYHKHPEPMTAQPSYPAMESRARVFAWRHGQHLASLREGFKETAKTA